MIDYFIHAYNHDHINFTVDFMFVKGCQKVCDYPSFDKQISRLIQYGIKVYNVSLDSIPLNKVEDPGMTKYQDKFESWIIDYRKDIVNERNGTVYSWFVKDNTINHYAFTLARYAMQTTNADFLMFLEDDIVVQKNFFTIIRNTIRDYKEGQYVAIKTMIADEKNMKYKFHDKQLGFCIASLFGVMLGKKEFKKVEKFHKYIKWGVCVDAYSCYMDDFLNMSTVMFNTAKHIGYEKPKSYYSKFWM
ncbi:hypothetical protein EIN_041990 [Entamoeba invadens IP1]|uniref:Uncharacterized protein n=1 Tax=Entamoeba invadens IP1 TaxID=370355 RepID=L7FPH5_ENTIV|nr:hypothetical protein EIN_201190 [Entamoeba invadens IP1]XP_004261341.1 hypothetical protein EIN_041990 [Entamoeba invadens IP1]ELP89624.1 hypothetical protein EIN_201190 [Entamoeba invadens IP1]ELP94570.1 hypothetical protein EIN_041990 [Entamoeba invadens IP1]|eukprot:XP_004256395.1 hypothetical protein EIN_201190 [Entamoeba invadens IP1]